MSFNKKGTLYRLKVDWFGPSEEVWEEFNPNIEFFLDALVAVVQPGVTIHHPSGVTITFEAALTPGDTG